MAEPLEQNPRLPAAPASASAFPDVKVLPAEQTYRTLPIVALIGFGIGALYAAGIGLAALVGLLAKKPLLLSGWSILVPLSAVMLCLLARARIRASEGTLAGESLVRWGLLLSVFFGLTYWAYFAAVYVAVRQQASAFADAWLDQLREGDSARGAYNILEPLKRLNLHENELGFADEVEQHLARMEMPGKPLNLYDTFSQSLLVRSLSQAGKEAEILPRGIRAWDYIRGGYQVVLDYDIKTPEGTFEATVTVRGMEAPSNEYERRQWYVDFDQTRLNDAEGSVKLTPFGLSAARIGLSANEFVASWKVEMAKPGRTESYLLTLPKDERDTVREDLGKSSPLAAAAGPLGASQALTAGAALKGLTQFLGGSRIKTEPMHFHVADGERDEVVGKVYKVVANGLEGQNLEIARTRPFRKIEGGRIRLGFTILIGEAGNYISECVLEIEGDANALESKATDAGWRVNLLRIVSGKKTPMKMLPPPS